MIFLYNGKGAAPFCLESLDHSLKLELREKSVEVVKGDWSYFARDHQKFRSVILGGGSAVEMTEGFYGAHEVFKNFYLTPKKGTTGSVPALILSPGFPLTSQARVFLFLTIISIKTG